MMLSDVTNFRIKQFITERDTSSIAYEVKRTRAAWDPTLAVPGTERQGGWRCPPGTRYGGQITDRFGRNCGWGASRRIANSISDIGERLENIGDRRSSRRAARAQRAATRMNKPGLVERAAGNIARALETDGTPAPKPRATRPVRANRGAAARSPRLLPEERRRMQREIDQPNAPRTGDAVIERAPRRPRPEPAQARRRAAAVNVAERKPKPVAPEVTPEVTPAPVKKAAKKKVAAKKAPVKKKAAVKKAAARRITPAAGGEAEPPRLAAQKPQNVPANVQRIIDNKDGAIAEGLPLVADQLHDLIGLSRDDASRHIEARDAELSMMVEPAGGWSQDDLTNKIEALRASRRRNVQAQNTNIRELRRLADSGASEEQIKAQQDRILSVDKNLKRLRSENDYFIEFRARRARDVPPAAPNVQPAAVTPPAPAEIIEPAPLDGLRNVFAGRDIGYNRNWKEEKTRLREIKNSRFENMSEENVLTELRNHEQNIQWNSQYIANLQGLNPEQRIQMPDNKVVKVKDLQPQVQAVLDEWTRLKEAANVRLNAINADRLPGISGMTALRNQNLSGYSTIALAREEMARLASPIERFNIVEHNGKFYVLRQDQLSRAMTRGLDNPNIKEFRGGLPLANELPEVDAGVAAEAVKRVNDAIKGRQKILSRYLNKRYGEGNAPWKEMTPAKLAELDGLASRGNREAEAKLIEWAKQMYSHPEIEGQNTKTYRTIARPSYSRGQISVSVMIERKTGDNTWEQVGSSFRTLGIGGSPPTIYNNNMFITVAEDKNAGIQTIYNQHAFMYAKAAGFKSVGVSAVDDGRFVWGKIGFKQRLEPENVASIFDEVSKFRNGENSLINSDSDARIVEHLVGEWVKNPDSVKHMDFVMAVGNNGRTATAQKAREKFIKKWFINNMVFRHGTFDLDENKISADPRDEA